jgi:hypothetical protein
MVETEQVADSVSMVDRTTEVDALTFGRLFVLVLCATRAGGQNQNLTYR